MATKLKPVPYLSKLIRVIAVARNNTLHFSHAIYIECGRNHCGKNRYIHVQAETLLLYRLNEFLDFG